MRIKIKLLNIENFKGCRSLHVVFSNITSVYGANATGKSTIVDSFMWLLFDKDSHGNSKFQVRPLDWTGSQIDNVEIKVSAVLDVDGREVKLQKVQKQKWVKPRGRQEKELQGNINEFEINDIPKKEKDYNSYIADMVDEKVFKLITSPTAFTSMKWQEQRDILLKLVSEVTDGDVVNKMWDDERRNEHDDSKLSAIADKYSELSVRLDKNTPEELTAQAKKALSSYKKKQVELPARIDEVSKSMVDIDTAELELQVNALKEQIADLESQMDDSTAQYEQWQKQSDDILQAKMNLNEYVRNANAGLVEQRSALNHELLMLQQKRRDAENSVRMVELDKQKNQRNLEQYTAERNSIFSEWKKCNASQFDDSEWVFDESDLNCPMCGQALPDVDAEKKKADFEKRKTDSMDRFNKEKARRLEELESRGIKASDTAKSANDEICIIEKMIDDSMVKNETIKKEIATKEAELSALPSEVDLSDNQEFQSMQAEVIAMEEAHNSMTSAADIRSQLKIAISGKNEELSAVQRKIASADNTRTEERITELQEEQKKVGQQVADCEKQLYLLEQFTRAKMNLLSSKINGRFEKTNFILFKNQINGGMAECCECEYGGVPYSDLNSGHRIVLGLDIISTLQDVYGVKAPVWIDNAEGINEFNLPEMDCQMITLAVSENDALRVEVEL